MKNAEYQGSLSCPQRDSAEHKGYAGAQSVGSQEGKEQGGADLLERILSRPRASDCAPCAAPPHRLPPSPGRRCCSSAACTTGSLRCTAAPFWPICTRCRRRRPCSGPNRSTTATPTCCSARPAARPTPPSWHRSPASSAPKNSTK